MNEQDNSVPLEIKQIEKIFNQYKIKLSPNNDLIKIEIQHKEKFDIYESNFIIEELRKNKLLMGNITLQEMIEFINALIERKNIKIEQTNLNLKLILISSLPNYPNVELILNKKDLLSNEMIEKINKEIKNLKNENKNLKKNNSELNKKIKLIEEEDKNKKDKINEMEERMKKLENIYKEKPKNKINSFNLKIINSIQSHQGPINSLSCFPSGNIISVSNDKSINIYDKNLSIIQNIDNAHNSSINYVEIKDENNFITCSSDKNIKLWIKIINIFKLNKVITYAHEDQINKVIYCSNWNLISCSTDKKIKIWKEINNYVNIQTLTNSDYVYYYY